MKPEIDMKDVMTGMTMTVRVKRCKEWKLRFRIALWLIRLAAWISWFKFEYIEENGGEEGGDRDGEQTAMSRKQDPIKG